MGWGWGGGEWERGGRVNYYGKRWTVDKTGILTHYVYVYLTKRESAKWELTKWEWTKWESTKRYSLCTRTVYSLAYQVIAVVGDSCPRFCGHCYACDVSVSSAVMELIINPLSSLTKDKPVCSLGIIKRGCCCCCLVCVVLFVPLFS